ncbi:MAG: PaaI family thioesterase [Lachnospiraceae bacterium]
MIEKKIESAADTIQETITKEGTIEGFVKETGIRILKVTPGYAEGIFRAEKRHTNPNGSVHGGMLFTLADTIAGVAGESRGRVVTTINSNINYLKPAFEGDLLTAEAVERKVGATISVYDVSITNQKGTLIATATLTYFFLK